MLNPFFINHGPIPLSDILIILNIKNDTYKNEIIEDIKDLTNATKKNITFFEPSLLLWAHIISINDSGLAIINFGKRDVSFDLGNPIPINIYRNRKIFKKIKYNSTSLSIYKLNDQHAFLRHNNKIKLKIGDLISFGVSHPCITIDKWRCIYLINSNHDIIDVYKTFF